MKVLLDTNAYSAWKRGHEGTCRLVRRAEEVHLSAVVVGELLYGFRRGSRLARNLDELDELLDRPRVRFLEVTRTTADRFARITTALRDQGKPIPSNDIWIAAHALEWGSDLVSFDRHFEEIGGLVVTRPVS